MPLVAIRRISKARNGVSSFILPCKRLDFHYCDWAGSSRGMNAFLKSLLPKFSASNPSIEMTVSPRPHTHPIIRATYVNNREKVICVRKLAPMQVLRKAELLRDAGGEKLKRTSRVVKSEGGSRGEGGARGVWGGVYDILNKDHLERRGQITREEGAWRV